MNSITKKAMLSLLVTAAITQPVQAMSWKQIAGLTATGALILGGIYYLNSCKIEKEARQRKLNQDLYFAGYNKKFKEAQELIKAGADFNSRDHHQTTLYWAIYHGNDDMAIWLIDNGARLEGLSSDGTRENALDWALMRSGRKVIDHLIKKGACANLDNYCAFVGAAYSGMTDLVKSFLTKHPEFATQDNEFRHRLAIHLAARNGHIEIVQLLLDHGTHVNAPGANDSTPLHEAALYQHLDIVKLLVDKGANINIVDAFNNTPADLALRDNPLSPVAYYFQNERPSRALVQNNIHAKTNNNVPFNDALIFCEK